MCLALAVTPFDMGYDFGDSSPTYKAYSGGRLMGRDVLLIEDEPNIIEAIRFILARDGWHVQTHSDGKNAFEAVRDKQPDVVILDVMLPGRSGFEILRDIRGDDAISGMPVLMLTAKGQNKDREIAENLGVSRFMTKPFSNTDVLAAVRDLVAQ
jgi:DNA-binding response OmpR family regulator